MKLLSKLKKRQNKQRNGPFYKKDPQRRIFTRRALIFMAVQVGALGYLARRLYKIQIQDGPYYSQLAANNRTSKRFIAPPRACIKDRFGQPLANNQTNWHALLLPEEVDNIDQTINHFASIVPLSEKDQNRIERELRHKRRFVPILLRDFLSWNEMARIEINAPSLRGIIIDTGTNRIYPQGEKMAHVIGYVAPPNEQDVARSALLSLPGMRIGRSGIEQTQDKELRGEAGLIEMKVNASGRIISEISKQDGSPGKDISLTIDSQLQQQVLERIGNQTASAVVMDCNNGEIYALANTPSFDPSLFNTGIKDNQWKSWINDPHTPLINKAISGAYPPGSTFKPAVAMAALDSGIISPQDNFLCPGYLDIGGARFHCWRRWGHGYVNMHEGLKKSCDVYFYEVARRIGMERIANAAHNLGLGVPLDIELPHARTGFIPNGTFKNHRKHWNTGDTIVSSIGQGFVQVTPLQLATYAARLSSGRRIQPHLIRTASTHPHEKLYNNLPYSHYNMQVIRNGMYAVVNAPDGTAPKARLDLPGITMAGKTGSSQVRRVSRALRESGHFNSAMLPWEYRPHALFICFAPYESPQYAVSVVIEHGNAGADAAAPLASDIMRDTLARNPCKFSPTVSTT